MRFPTGLRALNHRDFRLFWTGQLVSLIGTWMQSVGQSWLVLELTNSSFRLGLIGALVQIRAEGLPQAGRDSSVLQDVVAGVRYAMGIAELRLILSLMLSVSLFVMNHVGSISARERTTCIHRALRLQSCVC